AGQSCAEENEAAEKCAVADFIHYGHRVSGNSAHGGNRGFARNSAALRRSPGVAERRTIFHEAKTEVRDGFYLPLGYHRALLDRVYDTLRAKIAQSRAVGRRSVGEDAGDRSELRNQRQIGAVAGRCAMVRGESERYRREGWVFHAQLLDAGALRHAHGCAGAFSS